MHHKQVSLEKSLSCVTALLCLLTSNFYLDVVQNLISINWKGLNDFFLQIVFFPSPDFCNERGVACIPYMALLFWYSSIAPFLLFIIKSYHSHVQVFSAKLSWCGCAQYQTYIMGSALSPWLGFLTLDLYKASLLRNGLKLEKFKWIFSKK